VTVFLYQRRTETEVITFMLEETVWDGVVHFFNLTREQNAESERV
jgi:hypothetical protein